MAIYTEIGDAGDTKPTAQSIGDIGSYTGISGVAGTPYSEVYSTDVYDNFSFTGDGFLSGITIDVTNVRPRGSAGAGGILFAFGLKEGGNYNVQISEGFTIATGLTIAGGVNFTAFTVTPNRAILPGVNYVFAIGWGGGVFDYDITYSYAPSAPLQYLYYYLTDLPIDNTVKTPDNYTIFTSTQIMGWVPMDHGWVSRTRLQFDASGGINIQVDPTQIHGFEIRATNFMVFNESSTAIVMVRIVNSIVNVMPGMQYFGDVNKLANLITITGTAGEYIRIEFYDILYQPQNLSAPLVIPV